MKYNIRTLISEEDIEKRCCEMAEEISRDYAGKEIYMVGILRGAVYFLTALSKRIDPDIPVTIDFLEASSYGNSTTSSGTVRILKDLDDSCEGKNLLIVEDIIDTGITLNYLLNYFHNRKAASVRLCTLLNKPSRRLRDVKVDYVGFEIEDRFVVGCGMDYAQELRNLPYIGEIIQ